MIKSKDIQRQLHNRMISYLTKRINMWKLESFIATNSPRIYRYENRIVSKWATMIEEGIVQVESYGLDEVILRSRIRKSIR